MSTPSEFMQAIGGGDVASGLLNRFLIVKSDIGVQMSQQKRRSSISERLATWAKQHASAQVGDLDAGNVHDIPPHPIEVSFSAEAKGTSSRIMRSVWSMPSEKRQAQGWRLCNRSREIAMRLSLIVSRSMGQEEITADAMNWSIDYVDYYAKQTIEMFRANMANGPFEALARQSTSVLKRLDWVGLQSVKYPEAFQLLQIWIAASVQTF